MEAYDEVEGLTNVAGLGGNSHGGDLGGSVGVRGAEGQLHADPDGVGVSTSNKSIRHQIEARESKGDALINEVGELLNTSVLADEVANHGLILVGKHTADLFEEKK